MCQYEIVVKDYKSCKLPEHIKNELKKRFTIGATIEPDRHIVTTRMLHQCPEPEPEEGSDHNICYGERLTEKEEVETTGKTTVIGDCPVCAAVETASQRVNFVSYTKLA